MKFIVKDRSKVFLCVSAAIMIIALVMSIAGVGMNLGIDFTGGIIMKYDMGADFDVEDVKAALSAQGIDESQIAKSGADGHEVQIRIKDIENSDEMRDALEGEMMEKYPDISFITVDRVGAVAGRDLIANAVKSVLVAAVLMLAYIAIRFDLYSGMAAVIGLLHDVLLMVSCMVLLRSFVQVNSTFIAALLTIVGYSINNTIIIFDRIRENLRKSEYKALPRVELVNKSVDQSLNRTISTTLTTLITVVALYVLGVDSVREFALPLIIGMLAGVYSSNGINGYVWAFLMGKRDTAKANAKK